jgi:hypothetical protein
MVRPSARLSKLAERYVRFAETEARGSSPTYEKLALAVSCSVETLEFIAGLPEDRQQPNLFLAAVRKTPGIPRSGDHLVEIVRQHAALLRKIMLSRTTQTNEPARCAVLLPLQARLPQPLALLEVGASAGLCLLPDLYGYEYPHARLIPRTHQDGPLVVFSCEANDATPLPIELPTVVWRCGLDLNPLDLRSHDDVDWLQTLVWPDHVERAERLRAAVEMARADPPAIIEGDLLKDLPMAASSAPKGATLVVFHTAVLSYVSHQSDRERFAKIVRELGAVWVSNEPPSVFPEIRRQAPPAPAAGLFLLSMDGKALAWTGPHGQKIHWFAT